ncbi:uridylate kinase [archaeon BMS3Abin17]|nr:uridylate kinase [archaeon BMS3Abin17]HDZ60795.1 UMP kinase [Candidatus Pacearchaeota archaeon]
MQKKVIVLSLGGSLIIPDKVDIKFLKEFKRVIKKNTKKHKFIIVCGGGSVARKYISALRKLGINEKLQSLSGISATRMNARFMNYLFGNDMEKGIPHKIKYIKEYLKKQDVVFCGALEYKPQQTSDSTSAEIAKYFKTEFINLTNVQGLHDQNPLIHKNARFIPKISWKDFDKMANKSKFKPGQHFVLDQTASEIIMKNRITTYILGKNLNQLDQLLDNKKFKGTVIRE